MIHAKCSWFLFDLILTVTLIYKSFPLCPCHCSAWLKRNGLCHGKNFNRYFWRKCHLDFTKLIGKMVVYFLPFPSDVHTFLMLSITFVLSLSMRPCDPRLVSFSLDILSVWGSLSVWLFKFWRCFNGLFKKSLHNSRENVRSESDSSYSFLSFNFSLALTMYAGVTLPAQVTISVPSTCVPESLPSLLV
jgi:hypothetical protein